MAQSKPTETGLTRLASALEPGFPLRLLGFGLIYVWSSCIWETSIFFPSRVGAGDGTMFDIWLVSACLTPLACLACAFAGRKRELTDYPALLLAGPLLAVVGTVCIALLPFASPPAAAVLGIAAAVGTGIGPAIMIVLWIALYARLDTEVTETVVPGSFLLIVVCMLVIPQIAAPVAIPIAILLPIMSGALLLISLRAVGAESTFDAGGERNAARNRSAEDTGLETSMSEGETPDGSTRPSYPLASMLRTFVLILIAYAISCTISFLQQDIAPALPDSTATIIGMLFAVALSTAIVLFASRIDLEVYFRWMSAPLILSIVFAAFPNSIATTVSAVLANSMFTSLEIIMILYFIRLSHSTKRPASFFIGIGSCATYTGLLIGYLTGMHWGDLAAGGSTDVRTLCLVLVGILAVAMLLVPRKDSAWTGARQKVSDTERSVEPDIAQPSFDALCDDIAARFKLSARETEIFKLLAQGRSQPYIRDLLYLSKNTVSTHIKHIYRKLDIHSKEELIDLIADK